MTEQTAETEGLAPELAAQVAEAMETAPEASVKPKTKIITVMGRQWHIRNKPSAAFLYHYESGHLMHAAEALLSAEQFATLLELDPDIEGDMEEFFRACERAYGLSGN